MSKELNHLAAILHVYAGGLNFMTKKKNFCYWHFLKTSIFEPLCFPKWCPIFDGLCEYLWKSNKKIVFILLIFFLKSTPCWLKSAKLHHWGHTNIFELLCMYFCKKGLFYKNFWRWPKSHWNVFTILCKLSDFFRRQRSS